MLILSDGRRKLRYDGVGVGKFNGTLMMAIVCDGISDGDGDGDGDGNGDKT